MDFDFDDVVAFGTLATIIALMVFLGASSALRASTANRCLEAGWRDSQVTWTLARYCIAREDQTDVVKPLAYAEAHPR